MLSTDAAAFATRTQETAGEVTDAALGYGRQEDVSAGEMSSVSGVTVV